MFGSLRPAVSLAVSSAVPARGSWEAGGRTRGPMTTARRRQGAGGTSEEPNAPPTLAFILPMTGFWPRK